MKVWTNNQFAGICPVGAAAVVVAETVADAAALLTTALAARGLGPALADEFVELPTDAPLAVILRDGDY